MRYSSVIRRAAFTGAALIAMLHAARADTLHVVTSPWGSAPVAAVVGTISGEQWLVWQRLTDNSWRFTKMGGTSGLTDSWAIHGSNSDDAMFIQSGTDSRCGFTITAPVLNG